MSEEHAHHHEGPFSSGGEGAGGEAPPPPPPPPPKGEGALALIFVVIGGILLAVVAIAFMARERKKKLEKEMKKLPNRRAIRETIRPEETDTANMNVKAVVGRKTEISDIVHLLVKGPCKILLTGPPGVGKTFITDSLVSNPQAVVKAVEALGSPQPINRITSITLIRASNVFHAKRDLLRVAISLIQGTCKRVLEGISRRLLEDISPQEKAELEKKREAAAKDFENLENLSRQPFNERNLVQMIQNILNSTEWVLILDGLEDPTLLDTYFPPNKGGRIIVTSNLGVSDFRTQFTRCIAVSPLRPEESLEVFELASKSRPSDADKKVLASIIDRLDSLPLATFLLGRYAGVKGLSVAQLDQALGSGELSLTTLVGRMFEDCLSLEEPGTANANKMMEYLSFLSPVGIPTFFFQVKEESLNKLEVILNIPDIFEGHDRYARLDCLSENTSANSIKILQKLGLIDFNRLIFVHPLVQHSVRALIHKREEAIFVMRPMTNILSSVLSDMSSKASEELMIMIPSVMEFLEHLPGLERISFLKTLGEIFMRMALSKEALKLLKEAQALLRADLSALEGAEVGLIDFMLGQVYHMEQNYKEAIASNIRALKIWDTTGHVPNQLATLESLANSYFSNQDFASALATNQRHLKLLEDKNGRNSEKLLTALIPMSNSLLRLKRHEEAEEHLQRALKISREEHGPNDFSEVPILFLLATLKEDKRDFSAALSYAKAALDIQKENRNSPYFVPVLQLYTKLQQTITSIQQHLTRMESATPPISPSASASALVTPASPLTPTSSAAAAGKKAGAKKTPKAN